MSDLNLAGLQVARGKCAAYEPDVLPRIVKLAGTLSFLTETIYEGPQGMNPLLNKWFSKDTLAQLRYIWEVIRSQKSSNVRSVLEMLFTDVLFRCASLRTHKLSGESRRRHHWGWIADNVTPTALVWHDARELFRKHLYRTIEILSAHGESSLPVHDIRQADIADIDFPSDSVDLIVTSPPYVGMIDYTMANRLTYLWYGWDVKEQRRLELGARYRRNNRDAVGTYMSAMTVAVDQISRVLRPSGYCAVVIGTSRKFPEAASSTLAIFANRLTVVWGPTDRKPTRRRISPRSGTAPVEQLCVFQK